MTKGEKIKILREQAGLSQVGLADKINVTKQTMYKYENDIITNIPSDKIEAIARVCHSTPEYIMGWSEAETNNELWKLAEEVVHNNALFDKIAKLDSDDQETIQTIVDAMLQKPKYKKGGASSAS